MSSAMGRGGIGESRGMGACWVNTRTCLGMAQTTVTAKGSPARRGRPPLHQLPRRRSGLPFKVPAWCRIPLTRRGVEEERPHRKILQRTEFSPFPPFLSLGVWAERKGSKPLFPVISSLDPDLDPPHGSHPHPTSHWGSAPRSTEARAGASSLRRAAVSLAARLRGGSSAAAGPAPWRWSGPRPAWQASGEGGGGGSAPTCLLRREVGGSDQTSNSFNSQFWGLKKRPQKLCFFLGCSHADPPPRYGSEGSSSWGGGTGWSSRCHLSAG